MIAIAARTCAACGWRDARPGHETCPRCASSVAEPSRTAGLSERTLQVVRRFDEVTAADLAELLGLESKRERDGLSSALQRLLRARRIERVRQGCGRGNAAYRAATVAARGAR